MAIQIEQSEIDMRARVAQLTDKLGREMDAGIIDTVVALNLAGFTTVQSCEGHLDHGAAYPWVNLADVEWERSAERDWERVALLREQANECVTLANCNRYLAAAIEFQLRIDRYTQQNAFYQSLCKLLDAFYANTPPTPYRLCVTRFKTPGRYRLEPGLAKEDIPVLLKEQYLCETQAEMRRFTAFLRRSK